MSPADDDARRQREIERLARCIADDEPLSSDSTHGDTHFGAFVELKQVIDGFRDVQQRFATRRATTQPAFRFGPLDVLDKLGEGSQGEVYRAYDPVLDQFFALKLRRPEFGTLSSDFLDEARHLARVHHPNVIRVFGAANVDGRAGLWTELINGRSLESMLASTPTLATHDSVEIGSKLCDALAALHTSGIVHGDIKASNVMLEDSGRVVLMDFGSAQRFRAATQTPVTMGTLPYLAPELLHGAAPSPQSDVYALGVLMFRTLTGTFPYGAANVEGLILQHGKESVPQLARLAPHIPTSVAQAVQRAIAVDPSHRHRGAAAFAAALWPPASFVKTGVAVALSIVVTAALVIACVWMMRRNAVEASDVDVGLVRETANEGRETLRSGSTVKLGDEIAVEFKSAFPAYVYIFGSSENNQATVLFPISGAFPANPLAAGTLHHIPGSIDGRLVDWQVATDAPSEEIVVLVAREPQPDLDREITRLAQANADDAGVPSLPRSLSKLVAAPEILTVGNPYLREVLAKTNTADAAEKIRVWDFRLPHAH